MRLHPGFVLSRAALDAPPAAAGVGYDAVSVNSWTSGSSMSWTHIPMGAPSGVAVFIGTNEGVVAGITYGGVAMSNAATGTPVVGDNTAIWTLGNPPAGPQTIVVSFSTPPAIATIGVAVTVVGGDPVTVTSNSATTGGAGSTPSVTCPSAVGELVVTVAWSQSGTAAAPGSGQTEIVDQNPTDHNCAVSYKSGAASVLMDWTITGGVWWSQSAISFKAA
jgi:hypothetical protein